MKYPTLNTYAFRNGSSYKFHVKPNLVSFEQSLVRDLSLKYCSACNRYLPRPFSLMVVYIPNFVVNLSQNLNRGRFCKKLSTYRSGGPLFIFNALSTTESNTFVMRVFSNSHPETPAHQVPLRNYHSATPTLHKSLSVTPMLFLVEDGFGSMCRVIVGRGVVIGGYFW